MHRYRILISLILIIGLTSPTKGQGVIYKQGQLITLTNTLPIPCDDGNIIVLSSDLGVLLKGTIHSCKSNIWIQIVPATVLNNGTSLPSTCIIGTIFTVTPLGGLWTCPITNSFVPIGAIVAAKNITGIQNNIFTDILTFTVPNVALGVIIEAAILASIGAGGAVGQYETTTGRTVLIAITRTPGLSTDAVITTTATALDAKVIGGIGVTITTQLSAISGANNATQTLTLQLRITRGGGASNNHIASLRTSITSPTLTTITVQ
jgi:hypothetical protein